MSSSSQFWVRLKIDLIIISPHPLLISIYRLLILILILLIFCRKLALTFIIFDDRIIIIFDDRIIIVVFLFIKNDLALRLFFLIG